MISKLNQLKTVISDKEILSPTQMFQLKGGADGDDLRRNSLLRISGTITTTGSTTTISGTISTSTITISGTIAISTKK